MNTNKKNEYYSSEDTVKVKIGEKLTWKRVVVGDYKQTQRWHRVGDRG
jgi:hypothetical protein